jgi:hypothetical protein
MRSTNDGRVRALAGALYDEVVSPLAEARKTAGKQEYFSLSRESGAGSYYQEPVLRVMKPEDFEFPGGGTAAGLIDALAAAWTAEGETNLAAMAPQLQQIADTLKAEAAEGDGSVSIFCYTMF